MTQKKYKNPVAKLLEHGDIRGRNKWPDYINQYGFTNHHIPELIEMAIDETLNLGDPDSDEVWAPLHAWRTLGQLRAEEAIEPLMNLFHMLDDDDWSREELPEIYQMIGPKSIPALEKFIHDDTNNSYARTTAAHALEKIAQSFPEAKKQCQNILTETLKHFKDNDIELNSLVIHYLVEMHAVDALPIIRKAFENDMVDEMVRGDLEDIEIDLGVREKRSKPRAKFSFFKAQKKIKNKIKSKQVINHDTTGRNDPCPCGSGKKYKKCCLNKN
ncbi:SEC-C motif domain containing protein [Desulfamplus magnetovallimortis]|uniref:SEC-C motif domain containing protein n=1 Tax=Desulfamplus magnetovallimortis TaxID=1246637 RepID=A0A1W1HHL7_9BACT|nr:HEAT repeat domain-containing protein [Desulfamplus magnetovallimortis]SLM31940.1 SEC-C motif domain containing protein [Desulfamplus magnetovallimortis]